MKLIIRLFIFSIFILTISCNKEKISVGTNVQDLFYLENKGATMPILVEGNTASHVIILWVHGGPGSTAIGFYNDEHSTKYLESEFAVAYWDQRAAGGSQGSFTPKLELSHYTEDLNKVILLLKHRYGDATKVFIMSHNWGGMVSASFLTNGNNQNMLKGWINVAGNHNCNLNDSFTQEYLIRFGNEQILANQHKKEWEDIVKEAEANVPDNTMKTSRNLNLNAFIAEYYIDDIKKTDGGAFEVLKDKPYAFSLPWAISNSSSTLVSNLNKDILTIEYSSKLPLIKLPLLCITGKYDFMVSSGMANEVIQKTSSAKKNLVILPQSGHQCMKQEPDLFYPEVLRFVKDNL